MKKFLCLLLAVMLVASLFVACDNVTDNKKDQPTEQITEAPTEIPTDGSTEAQKPEKLVAPTVSLEGNIAKWSADEKAERFEISISGELIYLENSVTERTLSDGQTFKIRAIGDGLNYTTSDWSNLVTYTAPTAEEPTETPTEEKPTETHTEEKPTEAPTEEKPTEAPTEEKPTEAPTEEKPTETPTEEKPTEAPTEEKPTETPTEEKPTESPTEEKPTETPTEEKPTETPTEEKPTETPTEEKPTEVPTEEKPTETPTEEKPTESPTEPPVVEPTYQENTLSFADKAQRIEFTAEIQVWEQNGIILTNEKAGASSPVADYANPARFYQGSSISIACNGMTKIVFNCNSSSYVTDLKNSLSNAGFNATVSGQTVTLEFANESDVLTFICSKQIRLNSITVTSLISGEGGNEGGTTPPATDHIYTDFTSDEKALFTQYIGEIVPFIPNDEYYVEGYYDETGYEYGMSFYTFGNTQAEFDAYLTKFSSYELYDTYDDEDGDTWYCYIKNDDVVVDVSFYYNEGDYVVDLYVYSLSLSLEYEGGDEGNVGDGGSGSTTPSDVDLITNDGKGLPQDEDGVFDVDFTKAENVKDVTDQGYYLDGCPTTGTGENAPAVLVIPVEFSDITAQSKGYTTANIEKIFNGTGSDTIYYSVDEYFKKSSYGKLDLNITVLDDWFRPQYDSSHYENSTYDYSGEEVAIGDQLILDEALAYLEDKMDLTEFDSDGNGVIDAVVLVTTLEIGEDDFHWAYRYWNFYTDDDGYYFEYDAVSANDYVWLSYQFMFESDSGYTETDTLNPYTFIHEFSHILGATDYYDTSYSDESTSGPLDGKDMMDAMQGDHNPYTKFNYGWITSSRLIVADSVTVELEAFAENGDTIIIANNWDESLGAYQEYFVVMYYTSEGLNSGESGYFERNGIVVYHINASLYAEEYDGETCYDVYYNNTDPSDEYGTEENLIEYVKSGEGNFTYVEGDSLPAVKDDSGNTLCYSFTVDSIEGNVATLTFTKG